MYNLRKLIVPLYSEDLKLIERILMIKDKTLRKNLN